MLAADLQGGIGRVINVARAQQEDVLFCPFYPLQSIVLACTITPTRLLVHRVIGVPFRVVYCAISELSDMIRDERMEISRTESADDD